MAVGPEPVHIQPVVELALLLQVVKAPAQPPYVVDGHSYPVFMALGFGVVHPNPGVTGVGEMVVDGEGVVVGVAVGVVHL